LVSLYSTQEIVERISETIPSNRLSTIKEISLNLNISYGSVQNILTTDLDTSQVSAKFFSTCLDGRQRQQFLSISLELRDRAASDSSFLGNVITGDETCVYGYDPETRFQSSEWKSTKCSIYRILKTHQRHYY